MRRALERISLIDVFMWIVGGSIIGIVLVGSVATIRSGQYSIRHWSDFLIFGVAQGSVYALIALGYTLVYGILRMINFAHGEVFMSGAYTAFFVADALSKSGFLGQNPLLGLLAVFAVSMATSVTVAVILERVAYRPLRRAPRLVPLITAIGASFFLQYTFRGFYGSGFKSYPEVPVLQGSWVWGGIVSIQRIQVLVIVAAGLLMLALYTYVQRTRAGKAMRAVSEDKDVAALMGINVDAVIVQTFIIGAALAGAAGVLYALMFRQVHFFMGFFPGIKAFTAAVLGGIGNIPGAMLGGLFLGIFESVGPILFLDGLGVPAPYQLKDAIAFTMLVLILIFRPTGILGERLARAKA
ncbi:MAG: branched-chain amino acid ABC transporter permease [Chloroflexi bacterium]|nr:branched-chain amino acid ABC transporter permease [Chloroflexota bacterium]MBI4315999.1 branched-chain amino acid ABC transporter permease [Chloroflexota bacterium]MBI5290842.1 branched-chain amino acid ABC transporter permease [Chloroflexota bacterium]